MWLSLEKSGPIAVKTGVIDVWTLVSEEGCGRGEKGEGSSALVSNFSRAFLMHYVLILGIVHGFGARVFDCVRVNAWAGR